MPAHLACQMSPQWIESIRAQVDSRIAAALPALDEAGIDARWRQALDKTKTYALRGGKRFRPALLFSSYVLTKGDGTLSDGVWQFATAVELLHTFLLIHDDVADRSDTRRGGPALHLALADGKLGTDLAVVMGDQLFARAIELMLASSLPNVSRVVSYYLAICRQTAAGQFLDLDAAAQPLSRVTVFQTLKIAQLKTARYGFVAPLVAGAMLGNVLTARTEVWERVGRNLGLAYQLRDDLMGLFGESAVVGKPGDGDFYEGKRTFPVVAAFLRSQASARAELEALWSAPDKTPEMLERARALIQDNGGREAAERVIDRATRRASEALAQIPETLGHREFIANLIHGLQHRVA